MPRYLILAFLCCLVAWAQEQDPWNTSEPLAKVAGKAITYADVTKLASEQLNNLELNRIRFEAQDRRDRYQIKADALKSLIEMALLQKEAESKGLSVEQLIQKEVTEKTAPPTKEEIDALYAEKRSQLTHLTHEQAIENVKQFLHYEAQRKAGDRLVENLREKYQVESSIEPYRVDIDAAGRPHRGQENAPITIVTFSDFGCSLCKKLEPELAQLTKFYQDEVRLVSFQFPHKNPIAAEAALCVADQGKYFEMVELLFEDQERLKPNDLLERVKRLELDVATFANCLQSREKQPVVRKDQAAGARAGVIGTPTVFVNGRYLYGSFGYDEVAQLVEDELKRLGLKD